MANVLIVARAIDIELKSLREALIALTGTGNSAHHGSGAYTGSPHQSLAVTTPELRRLAKSWLASHRSLPPAAILSVADDLFASALHEEKTLAALILGYSQAARSVAPPGRIEPWLDQLAGWAEVDALCSNVFQAEELLGGWTVWGPWLRQLAEDPNINKRRASLVLLTGPVRGNDDGRLLAAAFDNLGRLQTERPILITKAVSWLLRSLVVRHRDAVVSYLEENRAALPAIAVREVSAKLETGRKTRPRSGATG